ncbi:MAG: D-ribose ABC transporter substrate-binding protein [Dictyoglomus sp. NZ13-RE01]|nr:MAG: D-ribose ABC transporter substrate-binding protein [Dictyoglomus sp. NZ13-RE01]
MKKFTKILSLLLILSLLVSLGTAQRRLRFGLFICSLAHPFFLDMKDGAEDAARKLDVALATFDARNDVELQTKQIEDAITMRFDAILLNPITAEGLVSAVKKANEAKIPVFTLDRDVVGGDRVCYIGTDNVKAAELGGKKLWELLTATKRSMPYNVVILEGLPGASSAIEREKGFKNALKPYIDAGNIKIVADLTARFDRATGLKVMEDIIAREKKIDAVIAANDEMALGALEALKSAGYKIGFPDGVIIVGFDAITDAVEAVKRGEFAATVAQAPYIMGYWGVDAAYQYKKLRWTPPKDTPTYAPTGAKLLGTPVMVVTKENVGKLNEIVKTPVPIPGSKR